MTIKIMDAVSAVTAVGMDEVASAGTTDYVVRAARDGVQVLAVARDRANASTFKYQLPGRSLELRADGRVLVRESSEGQPVGLIDAPWAKDATGVDIPTEYQILGDTLVQVLSIPATATFPVVADPRYRSTWYGGSADFSRSETKAISAGTTACAAIAGVYVWAAGTGVAVAAICGALAAWASIALTYDKCVSVKIVFGQITPWISTCYK